MATCVARLADRAGTDVAVNHTRRDAYGIDSETGRSAYRESFWFSRNKQDQFQTVLRVSNKRQTRLPIERLP